VDGGGSFRSEPRREGGVVGLHGDSVPSVPALEVADGRTRANLAQHLENAAAAIFTPKSNAKTGCAWDAEPTADSLTPHTPHAYMFGGCFLFSLSSPVFFSLFVHGPTQHMPTCMHVCGLGYV